MIPTVISPKILERIRAAQKKLGYETEYDFLYNEYNNTNSKAIAKILCVSADNVTHNILPKYEIPVRGRGGRRVKPQVDTSVIKDCTFVDWRGNKCAEKRRDDGKFTLWCQAHADAINRLCEKYDLTLEHSVIYR